MWEKMRWRSAESAGRGAARRGHALAVERLRVASGTDGTTQLCQLCQRRLPPPAPRAPDTLANTRSPPLSSAPRSRRSSRSVKLSAKKRQSQSPAQALRSLAGGGGAKKKQPRKSVYAPFNIDAHEKAHGVEFARPLLFQSRFNTGSNFTRVASFYKQIDLHIFKK